MRIVRVKGVQEFTDRHGKLRRYYRRKGAPKGIKIDTKLKGAALAAEVARLDAKHLPLRSVSGTLRILVDKYKKESDHWIHKIGDRTKEDYERVFAWLGKSMDKPLHGYTTPTVAKLRDKAKDQKGFKFANQLVTSLSQVFDYGVEQGDMESNPCLPVKKVSRPADLPDANRPWAPEEAVCLLKSLPIHVRAPLALAAFLGPREGDLCAMPRSAYADRTISFTASKNKRALELHVTDDLADILDEYLQWRRDLFKKRKREDLSLTLFVNSRLKPWTKDGLKTSFGKERDKLLEAGKIEAGVTIHGARHTVAGILADAGFEKEDRRHILGHGHEDISDFYARRAKRRNKIKMMAEAIQEAYREAGLNVINLGERMNRNVKPIG